MKTFTELQSTIKELKEFKAMQDSLKAEIETLEDELKEYMSMNNIDELATDEGKVTWREVISNRFNSTAFKKDFLDIYKEYTEPTVSKRFTVN